MKSGLLTTEFYFTLASAIVAVLIVLHVIPAKDGELMKDTIAHCFEAMATVVTAGWVVVNYIQSRKAVKVAHSQATAHAEDAN